VTITPAAQRYEGLGALSCGFVTCESRRQIATLLPDAVGIASSCAPAGDVCNKT
jgi:hypothetical protein